MGDQNRDIHVRTAFTRKDCVRITPYRHLGPNGLSFAHWIRDRLLDLLKQEEPLFPPTQMDDGPLTVRVVFRLSAEEVRALDLARGSSPVSRGFSRSRWIRVAVLRSLQPLAVEQRVA